MSCYGRFILDHSCGYEWMKQYNDIVGECLELYIDEYESLLQYRYQQVYLNIQKTNQVKDIMRGILKMVLWDATVEYVQL
ncbi:MAG: hypothetical protein CM15mV11_1130 [Caudoviricetes sp.]|nr:MAG: hypothetical protein CM15mV11_1130 [Caudoviricetes sp.]